MIDIKEMTLAEKQKAIVKMLAKLIIYATEHGYELTLGDAFRDPRVFGPMGGQMGYGAKNSNHKQRLAIDLNLFKNGQYLTKTDDHRPLGEYWESLGGCWGGRFDDGNHYSIEHRGFK